MANTRTLAVKALLRVNEGGFSNIVLDALLSGAQLEHRDRAFVSALFYGVLERRITLDKIIKKYSAKPLDSLEPAVLECLRIGFYQLIYMNSVPDMAAANETVEAVKQLGFATAAMALTDNSVSIDHPALAKEEKLAVILGTEGEGLMDSTISACDYTVKIPMSHGVDSLNVAAASAVAFWQLGH